MTDYDKLIEEASKLLDWAADAAPVSARQAIITGKVEDQRLSLIARLAHALVELKAERDHLAAKLHEIREVAHGPWPYRRKGGGADTAERVAKLMSVLDSAFAGKEQTGE